MNRFKTHYQAEFDGQTFSNNFFDGCSKALPLLRLLQNKEEWNVIVYFGELILL